MFPSQRPQYLQWNELHRIQKLLIRKPVDAIGINSDHGSGSSMRTTTTTTPAVLQQQRLVQSPIRIKQWTIPTTASRFTPLHLNDDFPKLTATQNSVKPRRQQLQQQPLATPLEDENPFANEDYLTFAQNLLPRMSTLISKSPKSKIEPDLISESSTSGISSQFRPSDIGITSRPALKSKSKKTSSSSRAHHDGFKQVTKTDHHPYPLSKLSVNSSVKSSIAKPLELKFHNKNAIVTDTNRRVVSPHLPGRKSLKFDTKTRATSPGSHVGSKEDDNDDDESHVTLCSNVERSVNSEMAHKAQEDRELMIQLCSDAVQKRHANLQHYTALVDKDRAKVQARVDKYQPDMSKQELQDLMLSFVTHRENVFKQIVQNKRCKSGDTCWHKKTCENDGRQDLPVYCLEGRTYLGGTNDNPRQPHTFADLANLKNPKHDPPGYRRFTKLVNMEGFNNDEILIHARGNQIRIDGVTKSRISNPVSVDQDSSLTVILPPMPHHMKRNRNKSKTIHLPKGVYPQRLSIGRSSTGVLVVQEPWKF